MEVNKRKALLSTVLVIVIILEAILYGSIYYNAVQAHKKTPAHTTTKVVTTTKPTYATPLKAGTYVVPVQWQSRARSVGYYCPSWNSTPGQIAPDICLPLNKN